MSEEKKQFKSKRLTKKQLKELREQHPETLYPLVAYHYELYNMIEAATKEGRKIFWKVTGNYDKNAVQHIFKWDNGFLLHLFWKAAKYSGLEKNLD